MASQRVVISGAALLNLLKATKVDVKLCGPNDDWLGVLTAPQAHALVKADPEAFVGGGSTSRCRYVRALRPWVLEPLPPTMREPLDDPHHWDDRAVLHYATDQTACVPRKIKDRDRADLWDAMLRRVPRPKSWRNAV